MTDTERISAWLDGDLDGAAADAVRARIAEDPAFARQVDAMRALRATLDALPDEAPPPALDRRVLARVRGPRRWPLAVVGGLVAAAALALAWPTAPARVLVAGTEWVAGQGEVDAGDVRVAIDGVAWVTVEPAGRAARVEGAEGLMDRTHVAAAIGGAVVTVGVLAGSAVVIRPGVDVAVAAGDRWTSAPPAAAAPPAGPREGEAPAATIARLSRELDAARADLAAAEAALGEARLGATVAQGQLAFERGEPVPWPDDLPDGFRPAAYEATVRAEVAKIPGATLLDLDCAEFPCIAIIQSPSTEPGWPEHLRPITDALAAGARVNTSLSASQWNDGQRDVAAAAVAVSPEGHGGPDVDTRTKWRAQAALEDAGEALMHPAP